MSRYPFTPLVMSAILAISVDALGAGAEPGNGTVITPIIEQSLAGIPGKVASIVTVDYAPGASTEPHAHPANTFVYVLDGSIEMQVKGGKLLTLGPGQSFYERPSDVHVVSRNASKDKPARFLVVFIKDQGAPVMVPPPR